MAPMTGKLVPVEHDGIEVITAPRANLAETVRAAFLNSYREGKTKRAYTKDLRQFFGWCAHVGTDPMACRLQHIETWVRDLEATITTWGAPTSPASVHRAVSTVRCFYQYAVDNEILNRNPVPAKNRNLHLQKVPSQSSTLGLDRDEAKRFLAAARDRGPLDGAAVSLMLHQGFRVSTVCDLNTDDLSTARGHRTVTASLKGGERQLVALAPVAAADLDTWLAHRTRSGTGTALARRGGAPRDLPLFIDERGERITHRAVDWIVQQARRAAGIEKKISPHWLRHTCITQLLDEGVPIRDVQVFVGHADPKTTIRYDHGRDNLDRSPAYRLSGIFG